MPSSLLKNVHIDDSLAKGVARQIIHDALRDIEHRNASFDKHTSRLTTLPGKPKKRMKILAKKFAGMFGDSLICQVRNRGKWETSSTMFFLDYSRHHQMPGAPITLEVMVFPVQADMRNARFFHTGLRVSQHVLERVIQRNGARSILDVTNELRAPMLYLFYAQQEDELDMPPDDVIMVPTPNGFLYCGNGGDQPYENMVLKTFITFVHFSQMSVEQLNQWHYDVSRMPKDILQLYPDEIGKPIPELS